MGDFVITRGHPVYLDNEWYRPDELFPVSHLYVEELFNLYAEPEHDLVIGRNKVVCSSLGGYCPRLAEKNIVSDVVYGRGYGSYEAEHYWWIQAQQEKVPMDKIYPIIPLQYMDLYPGRENIVILGNYKKDNDIDENNAPQSN
eukprot:TRINITY_DN5097_c0_g2_i1.p1 TRINITY_DN5097_c0_g2~~TRINITY_DN5097_c0_g2_i1.p1  ORF type:complete len:153 (-),score=48.82 TRINITY_DN5097_c0_g2_i1:111-539(-)